jgi:hypothetical protein
MLGFTHRESTIVKLFFKKLKGNPFSITNCCSARRQNIVKSNSGKYQKGQSYIKETDQKAMQYYKK